LRAVDRAALRASDADRERAVDLLRGHAQAGRLTVEELDERCSRAFSAVTFGELDAVTADLPPISAPPAAIAPLLYGAGYQLREQTPYRLLFVRTRRPVWTFALCVLVFPFGLLALLYTEEHHVAVDLQPMAEGTLVSAGGVAPPDVHDAFRRLEG
jgi:hypothetical protein